MTYLGDWMSADSSLAEVLVGRAVVNVREGNESTTLVLDNGSELTINAELGCCAYGVVSVDSVVGGTIMSVDTTVADDDNDDSYDAADSVYKIFLMKNGFPDGTITVESHEGSGYYGTGYTLYVDKPGDDQ